jgi:hypothetical protein
VDNYATHKHPKVKLRLPRNDGQRMGQTVYDQVHQ